MSSPSALLTRIPALRLLVPFMVGIIVQQWCDLWWIPLLLLVLAVAGYGALIVLGRTPQQRLRFRPWYTLPLAVVGLSLGWLCAIIHEPTRVDLQQVNGQTLTGRIEELRYTDFSMRMTVRAQPDGHSDCKVLVSTRGCNYNLRPGHVVAFTAQLSPVGNMGNPDEMDYANYLLRSHGIRYQQHLPVRQVVHCGESPTLFTRLSQVRHDLQQRVFNTTLSPQAQSFVVALLLGNSTLIDQSTRQQFSAAGVAHVLALSGLHVGFIALMIWWLLFPLDYLGLKKLRLIITFGAIVLFAVFTGLSPSVIRATVMIGFVFASILFYRRSTSLNALAMAALAILIFTPFALYHVGFQLSFITVAALLVFAQAAGGRQYSGNAAVNYVVGLVVTSLVAMLSTVALTAHYFHTVSVLSVLTNLLVLPVLPIFMVVAAVFLLVTAAGLHWPLLNALLDVIYNYISGSARFVDNLPLSSIQGVYVSGLGAALCMVLIALVATWLYKRDYRWGLAAGVCLATSLAHVLWVQATTPRQGMVVFNSFAATPVMYYNQGSALLWVPDDDEPVLDNYRRYFSGFLARHGINSMAIVNGDTTLAGCGVALKPPAALIMGKRMLAVGSGKWKRMTQADGDTTHLDYIIITRRYHDTASTLLRLYNADTLIISGALYETSLTPLLHECDSLHLPYYHLATSGAFIMQQ